MPVSNDKDDSDIDSGKPATTDSSKRLEGSIVLLFHGIWLAYPFSYFFIGLSQLVYVIPLIIHCSVKNKKNMRNGVILWAGITFLINAGCFGILSTIRIH